MLHAADEKTIELAKKEGRVSFYTSMGADESKVVADAFQAKYPAIRVEITRLGSEKLLQRIITQSRAGSHRFDAVTNSGTGTGPPVRTFGVDENGIVFQR